MALFQLRKKMTNEQIAKKLGIEVGVPLQRSPGCFYRNAILVGSRQNEKTFALHRPDLCREARKFTDEIEKD